MYRGLQRPGDLLHEGRADDWRALPLPRLGGERHRREPAEQRPRGCRLHRAERADQLQGEDPRREPRQGGLGRPVHGRRLPRARLRALPGRHEGAGVHVPELPDRRRHPRPVVHLPGPRRDARLLVAVREGPHGKHNNDNNDTTTTTTTTTNKTIIIIIIKVVAAQAPQPVQNFDITAESSAGISLRNLYSYNHYVYNLLITIIIIIVVIIVIIVTVVTITIIIIIIIVIIVIKVECAADAPERRRAAHRLRGLHRRPSTYTTLYSYHKI